MLGILPLTCADPWLSVACVPDLGYNRAEAPLSRHPFFPEYVSLMPDAKTGQGPAPKKLMLHTWDKRMEPCKAALQPGSKASLSGEL